MAPVHDGKTVLAIQFPSVYIDFEDIMPAKIATLPKSETISLPVPFEDTEVVRRILRALAGLEYGSVEIIVQDSKVVQIERLQRARFAQPLDIPRV
jgi:hypothetical protein